MSEYVVTNDLNFSHVDELTYTHKPKPWISILTPDLVRHDQPEWFQNRHFTDQMVSVKKMYELCDLNHHKLWSDDVLQNFVNIFD